jgi:predicted nucleotide-binding protein (sugar kinase/HSP70/actin superfamily)
MTAKVELDVLSPADRPQWRYFEQKPFTRADREHTTILFGGLTWKHERIVRGALKALGYRSEIIPTPTVADFQTGKEYGNYGQCSPTYFTVGSLVNHLKRLEHAGLSREEVVDRYVYITPESPCGPCRLGMYQSEYRLSTENSGFGGFRVIPFSQRPKLGGDQDAGLQINIDFSFALAFSVLMGDIINEVGFAIRPFEVNAGETEKVMEESIAYLEQVVAGLTFTGLDRSGASARAIAAMFPAKREVVEIVLKLHRWFKGEHLETLLAGLHHVAKRFDEIPVDRTRMRPVVKITGEFWAQTTEGDGNYDLFNFLEQEGAQLFAEPVATWFYYLLNGARQDNVDFTTLIDKPESEITRSERMRAGWRQKKKGAIIELIDKAYFNLYQKMRAALFDIPHEMVDQRIFEELAGPYYHTRLEGGEGHLEVGKNIYYHQNYLAHMVLSLKPFGCMPSTQSDAVQAAVQGAYGNMIYLPIETSGEGKVNALSRVQMALGEAKQKARKEFDAALAATGLSPEDLQEIQRLNPELTRPSTLIPHRHGTAGTAANLVYYVAGRIREGTLRTPDRLSGGDPAVTGSVAELVA